jgi:hypothetical protein
MQLIKLNLPQYSIDSEPADKEIGKIVDDELKKNFMGKSILVRGIASSEHPGKTIDELVNIIQETGTDRYDPARKGDRYENVEDKHIDLFAFPETITPESEVFSKVVWGFYHSAKAVHGYPVRIDIVMIYDASQLQQVTHKYEGRDEIKDDGFAFKDQENKAAALEGIIKIV